MKDKKKVKVEWFQAYLITIKKFFF